MENFIFNHLDPFIPYRFSCCIELYTAFFDYKLRKNRLYHTVPHERGHDREAAGQESLFSLTFWKSCCNRTTFSLTPSSCFLPNTLVSNKNAKLLPISLSHLLILLSSGRISLITLLNKWSFPLRIYEIMVTNRSVFW